MSSETRGRLEVPGTLISDYVLKEGEGDRLYLLLHGYSQSGEYILRRLGSALPEGATVLALNGPFPIPERRPDGYRIGFSWYFYNQARDDYYIDMRISLEMIEGALKRLSTRAAAITVIGYSQGGYLAPFVAARVPRVDRVIGIAARFLDDELGSLESWKPRLRPAFRMDAVHGEDDEIVPIEPSRLSHQRLRAAGIAGEFLALPGESHRITEKVRDALRRLLEPAR